MHSVYMYIHQIQSCCYCSFVVAVHGVDVVYCAVYLYVCAVVAGKVDARNRIDRIYRDIGHGWLNQLGRDQTQLTCDEGMGLENENAAVQQGLYSWDQRIWWHANDIDTGCSDTDRCGC